MIRFNIMTNNWVGSNQQLVRGWTPGRSASGGGRKVSILEWSFRTIAATPAGQGSKLTPGCHGIQKVVVWDNQSLFLIGSPRMHFDDWNHNCCNISVVPFGFLLWKVHWTGMKRAFLAFHYKWLGKLYSWRVAICLGSFWCKVFYMLEFLLKQSQTDGVPFSIPLVLERNAKVEMMGKKRWENSRTAEHQLPLFI